MTPFLQLILALFIIIFLAKMGGYISSRLHQPSVLGELLVGLLIGPSLINLMQWSYFTDSHLPETIHQFAELGVLLLMFIAGLDLHLTELARTGRIALAAGILGVILPLGLGWGAGMLFSMGGLQAVFIGLILSATSVSISAQTLMELGVLRSRVGVALLGAAVLDDILVVLGLSLFVAANQASGNGLLTSLLLIVRMIVYVMIGIALGIWALPRLSTRVDRLPISRGLVAFSFVVALLYAWAAEALGSMAAITGAFLAGLMFSRSQVKDRIESGISTIAYGVFVPVFFVNVGLSTNARALNAESLYLLLVLSIVAIVGKMSGSGLGAYLTGFSRLEAAQLGAGMVSRGEVGLIVASVGIAEGWLPEQLFSTIVGVVLITTLLTPPLLRFLFGLQKDPRRETGKSEKGKEV